MRYTISGNYRNNNKRDIKLFFNTITILMQEKWDYDNGISRFLSVKKWLLRKKHQIELAKKRGWRGYWVCLKGTTLLFYPCDSQESRAMEAAPKHLIIVDGAIMQPIPEHPKKDYIFCLSTAFGDAYLFQVREFLTRLYRNLFIKKICKNIKENI